MGSVSGDVKLLGLWSSPYVLRAKIALALKSINYEYEEEDLASKSDLLLRSNPVYKKVPVLIHGDRPISESLVIIQYIDEVWSSGPKLLPSDPYDRALARFWASFVDDKWCVPVRGILLTEGEQREKNIEDAIQATAMIEEAFVGIASKGGEFFGGEGIGIVDIAIGSVLPWFDILKQMGGVAVIDEIRSPNLFRWAQDFKSHAVVKGLMPDPEKLVEYSKTVIPKMKALSSQ